MNHKHIARRFEENDHIFKIFLRDVAVSGNNHYFCRVILRPAIVEDGMNKVHWAQPLQRLMATMSVAAAMTGRQRRAAAQKARVP